MFLFTNNLPKDLGLYYKIWQKDCYSIIFFLGGPKNLYNRVTLIGTTIISFTKVDTLCG